MSARERVACAVVLVAGCRGQQSALDPGGPGAAELFELTSVLFIGATIVLVIVTVLVIVGVLLPRRDELDHRRALRWVLGGLGVTLLILGSLLVYDAGKHRALAATPGDDAIQVRVLARKWWWDVTYEGTPASRSLRTANELRIPVGRPVTITLRSADVIHSFWVPNLNGKMDAIPGRENVLTIQADRPGVYRGQCAEFCGLQHARMAFYVIALEPEEYDAWYEAQLQPASPATDALARAGEQHFFEYCAPCHTVRGTLAMASVGPDLTHVASRHSLAAGTLPNRRGQLAGWVLDPQHIKPGAFMPPIDLDTTSVHALLHYLETLK